MAKRAGAVHVATTRRKYKDKVYETFLLRRTYRDGDKVRNETLGNISHLPRHVIELIRRALKGEEFIPAAEAQAGEPATSLGPDSLEIVRTRGHGHVAAVLRTIKRFGLDKIISARRSPQRDRVLAMIASRILHPGSKLDTTRRWHTTTLAEELGLETTDEDDLYEAMDWLLERQEKIEDALAERYLEGDRLVLYDVTSSYFEGRCCELARYGHSRDHRKDRPQIVFGVVTNRKGCPVSVEVFSGETGDPSTLGPQIQKLRDRFRLHRVILVGDRGMITQARIQRDLRENEVDWVSALRGPAIRKLHRAGAIQLELFDERNLATIEHPDYPGERLVVCRNPFVLEERTRRREELIQATEKELEKVLSWVRSGRSKVKDKAAIGLRVGKVIDRYKAGKYFKVEIGDRRLSYQRNKKRIEEDARLDGIYVIRTSVPESELPEDQVVLSYKQLSEVERAFRNLKTTALKVRPIYHYAADRVRAHIFLCMLAYHVRWHMERMLAPLLFSDDLRHVREREDPIAPTERSPEAAEKDRTKRLPDGEPAHSFDTLLADLATLARSRVRVAGDTESEFDILTTPSGHQRQILSLLGIERL